MLKVRHQRPTQVRVLRKPVDIRLWAWCRGPTSSYHNPVKRPTWCSVKTSKSLKPDRLRYSKSYHAVYLLYVLEQVMSQSLSFLLCKMKTEDPCFKGLLWGLSEGIWKGVCQGCILSLCLFNLHAEYIKRNAGLEEAQAGIKVAGRNINNLRHADATTLMAEREELKASWWKWKRRVKKLA